MTAQSIIATFAAQLAPYSADERRQIARRRLDWAKDEFGRAASGNRRAIEGMQRAGLCGFTVPILLNWLEGVAATGDLTAPTTKEIA